MIFEIIMLLLCVFLLGIVIVSGVQDLKLFKVRGKQLYTYKSIGRDKYGLLIIQSILVITSILQFNSVKSYVSIGIRIAGLSCLAITCIMVGIKCFRKNAFYEHMISTEGSYYAKERVQSYYWSKYVMKSDKEGLMLEIKNLLNDKKTVLEISVLKQDKEKLEAILATYGAVKKSSSAG